MKYPFTIEDIANTGVIQLKGYHNGYLLYELDLFHREDNHKWFDHWHSSPENRVPGTIHIYKFRIDTADCDPDRVYTEWARATEFISHIQKLLDLEMLEYFHHWAYTPQPFPE